MLLSFKSTVNQNLISIYIPNLFLLTVINSSQLTLGLDKVFSVSVSYDLNCFSRQLALNNHIEHLIVRYYY
jgi:hypothetical protein